MSLPERAGDVLAATLPRSWERRDLEISELITLVSSEFEVAGEEVCGLRIVDHIPNRSSIGASLDDWHECPGIRALPFADFGDPWSVFRAVDDFARSKALRAEIETSGWIAPLIIIVDAEGPYILEGAHRFVALYYMGVTHFPALVVLDTESLEESLVASRSEQLTSRTRSHTQ